MSEEQAFIVSQLDQSWAEARSHTEEFQTIAGMCDLALIASLATTESMGRLIRKACAMVAFEAEIRGTQPEGD